ncbi:MAG: hypothetical protein GF350_06650 [Chitinivibrionales bacterium]|nr:hypothetical protein [Chitinivibrionales bacterium]
MQRMVRFIIPFLALMVFSSYGSIKFYVAGTDELETAFGKGSDSVWYRTAAYDSILSESVVSDTEWIDSISESGPNVFANKMPNPMQWKFDNYIVVGIADSFLVPSDGDYVFTIKADEAMFIEIDGEIISDDPSAVFMYTTIDEALDPGLGTDGVPSASEYQATVNLTAGKHDLKFYFYEKTGTSIAELWWKAPGSTDSVVVPASAFGERKDFCAFEIEWINPDCAPGDDYPPTPLTLSFEYPPKPCVEPADTIWYVYDFFEENGQPDGEDIRTMEAVYETTFVTCEEQEVVEYIVWAETNDGRKSQDYEGSCNVIYVYGPDTAYCETGVEQRFQAKAPLNLQKDVQNSIYNMKGQRLNDKVLRKATTTNPASGQYLIKEEKADSKKARLRKESAVK